MSSHGEKPTFGSTSFIAHGDILGIVMRRFVSIVAILLLLTSAAPVMACVTGVAMNHEETACCQAMHGQCGEMAKMGCCRTEVRTDKTPQITKASPAVDIQWVCVAHLPTLPTPVHVLAPIVLHVPDEQSPPGLLTAKTTVLRI
jgi:hypothetical protein